MRPFCQYIAGLNSFFSLSLSLSACLSFSRQRFLASATGVVLPWAWMLSIRWIELDVIDTSQPPGGQQANAPLACVPTCGNGPQGSEARTISCFLCGLTMLIDRPRYPVCLGTIDSRSNSTTIPDKRAISAAQQRPMTGDRLLPGASLLCA